MHQGSQRRRPHFCLAVRGEIRISGADPALSGKPIPPLALSTRRNSPFADTRLQPPLTSGGILLPWPERVRERDCQLEPSSACAREGPELSEPLLELRRQRCRFFLSRMPRPTRTPRPAGRMPFWLMETVPTASSPTLPDDALRLLAALLTISPRVDLVVCECG
jgi:hypothetical protein